MAFTREFIRKAAKEIGVELPKELEDVLVQEHLSARDAYAAGQVKTALEENKQDPPPAVKDTQEYKDLKKEYEDYKAGVSAKETKSAKEAAARAYYDSKGITGKALDIAMRGSNEEISALELEDGKIKDTAALDALVEGDFSELVTPSDPGGNQVRVSLGGSLGGGKGPMSKEEIFKIKDPTERQNAIAENIGIFRKDE